MCRAAVRSPAAACKAPTTTLLHSLDRRHAQRPMPQTVAFTVNGRDVSVTVTHDDTPLLDVLRNQLRLTGTRFGCGLEQCGCFIVLIDGKPVKSCGRAIASVAGRSVTTIEGLGTPGKPAPLHQPFLEGQGGQ